MQTDKTGTRLAGDYNQGHAIDLPLAPDVQQRAAVSAAIRLDDTGHTSSGSAVSPADAARFRDTGFLVKRGRIDDPAALAATVDYLWQRVPRNVIRRHAPHTWLAAPQRPGAPRVRIRVPCDWQRAGRTCFDEPQFGPGADFQWWIDTRNLAGDEPPTPDNLWNDWAI